MIDYHEIKSLHEYQFSLWRIIIGLRLYINYVNHLFANVAKIYAIVATT